MNDFFEKIGPLAILIAALTYVVKSWWDDPVSIKMKRLETYEPLLSAINDHSTGLEEYVDIKNDTKEQADYLDKLIKNHDVLSSYLPNIYLFASRRTQVIYVDFMEISGLMIDENRETGAVSSEHREVFRLISAKLINSMRSDLFAWSPTEIREVMSYKICKFINKCKKKA